MENISNIRFTECQNSLYLKPSRMIYEQDGQEKIWDLMRVHDSVAAVIYNANRQVLLFVRQFRPAVYYADIAFEDLDSKEPIDTTKYPTSAGFTIELCAGIVDKDQSLEETMRDEILEECGYDVPLSTIHKITSCRAGVGVAASKQTLFYTEITDAMKVSEGGGKEQEGECIEMVEMGLAQAQALIYDEKVARPPSLLWALLWFFANKTKLNQKL